MKITGKPTYSGMLIMNHLQVLLKLLICPLILVASISAAPSLQDFPVVSKIWIGANKANFALANSQEFSPQADTKLSLHVGNGARLDKGFHWGTINPVKYRLKSEELILEERKVKLQIDELEDANSAKLLSLEADYSELESKITKLNQALQTKQFDEIVVTRINKARQRLITQKLRVESKFDNDSYLEESIFKEDQLKLTLRQKKRSFETLEYHSILKAPFSGKLEILLPESSIQTLQKGETIWLPANIPYARLVDSSQINLKITPNDALLQHHRVKGNLSAIVHTGSSGSLIRANFNKEELLTTKSSKKSWIFSISPDDMDIASPHVGADFVTHIFLELDEPAYLVKKNTLAPLHPQTLEEFGWAGVIRQIWPNAEIIATGPQSIAIRK